MRRRKQKTNRPILKRKIRPSFSSRKWVFFRNFRDISTITTPRITFYCIFIKKISQQFRKKSSRDFGSAFGAAKTLFFRSGRRSTKIRPGRFFPKHVFLQLRFDVRLNTKFIYNSFCEILLSSIRRTL